MRARLFETLTISRRTAGRAGARLALPLSITAHGLVVAALATLPLWSAAELPEPLRQAREALPVPIVRLSPGPTTTRPTSAARPRANATTAPRGPSIPVPVGEPDGPPQPDSDAPFDASVPFAHGPACPECTGPVGTEPVAGGGDPAGTSGPRVARVGRDVQAPRKLRDVAPVYPELARRAHVEGRVVLECTIDTSGRIVGTRVLAGHPLLDGAAAEAVDQWLYKPTLLDGVPVPVLMTVTVHFSLPR